MSDIRTIDFTQLSTPEVHAYLLSAVAPRPIAFASTVDADGQVNLSPFSFFNAFGSNPPLVIFSPARRVRGNTTKHTLDNIREVAEVVINIVNYPMVEQMSLASTEYPKGVNEFVKAGFTQVPSERVAPPRVGEAPVAMECIVDRIIETGQEGGAANLVLARVVLMHIRTEYLDGHGQLDTQKLDLVARMGGSWYCRAQGDALFEIPKPTRELGIGIDQLPYSIRNSPVLTGNNLGRLGGLSALPSKEDMEAFMTTHRYILNAPPVSGESSSLRWHRLAQSWLEGGRTEEALKLLLATGVD